MSGKRGRKCSMKNCDSYQHTHKHLSFFRFPKDVERCKIWIERSGRPDLRDKVNVHEERVCERHFAANMFLNDYRNRLHASAVPSLRQIHEPPATLPDHLKAIDLSLTLVNENKLMKRAEMLYKTHLLSNDLTITPSNGYRTSNGHAALVNQEVNITSSQPLNLTKMVPLVPETIATPPAPVAPPPPPSAFSITSNAGYKRPRQIFTLQQEEQLAAYVRDTANYYSGLSSKEVRIMAFVYAVCNQVEMPVGWRDTHQASFDWCIGFIKRNKLSPMVVTGLSYKSNNNNNILSAKSQNTQVPKVSPINSASTNGSDVKMTTNETNGNGTANGDADAPIEIDD